MIIDTRQRNKQIKALTEVQKNNGGCCICCGSVKRLKTFFPTDIDRDKISIENSCLLCSRCFDVALSVNRYFKK